MLQKTKLKNLITTIIIEVETTATIKITNLETVTKTRVDLIEKPEQITHKISLVTQTEHLLRRKLMAPKMKIITKNLKEKADNPTDKVETITEENLKAIERTKQVPTGEINKQTNLVRPQLKMIEEATMQVETVKVKVVIIQAETVKAKQLAL